MGRLVYVSIGSLDGFINDEHGEFDWSAPDAEVHSYLNERDSSVVLELYGRRLYDVMKVRREVDSVSGDVSIGGPELAPVRCAQESSMPLSSMRTRS
ncbi:hypothetical protein [Calidifontibacter indicus]|uniref:hypothetical protein n=1 Tax=Calidifontibacter indicus TaxID=419650 RepID=UPI003D71EBCB